MGAVLAEASRMGDYVVLRRVAIGGMAEIFLARREGMSGFERLVVLKRILPEYAHNQDFVRMFLNEARIAATLHHTNIVQVHTIGEEQGQVFFAMEFLHGEDLSRVLSRAGQIGRPLQLDAVLTIMSAVCAGLHYAHERTAADGSPLEIVHRDVSPHNVFVTYDGNIKLLDFGIAKASTSIGKTRTGVLKGKVAYMSPEQAYSQPVDRRSDIFCIGILLWELSTGRRLYRRRSELETLKALVDHDAPHPSTVVSGYPVELAAIVMKCLARDPKERYATCDEVSQALEQFAQGGASLQVSPLIATRMMRTLFKPEIASFEQAIKDGKSLVDEVIARMEATARKSSIDDWDSDVASVIVDDIGSDPSRKVPALAIVPDEATTVTNPPAMTIEPPEEPTNITPPPRFIELPTERPVYPGVAAEFAPDRPSQPAVVEPPPLPATPTPEVFVPAKQPPWGLIGGIAAVAAIAVVVVVVMSGGDGDAKARPAADPAVATEPAPKPTPEPVAAPDEPEPEPAPVAVSKRPEPKKPPVEITKPEPRKPAVDPKKPEPRRPEPRKPPVDVKKPEPRKPPVEVKKLEPKKPPEPKKPTAKDLDSLPL